MKRSEGRHRVVVALLSAALLAPLMPTRASAQAVSVTVRLTIERIRALECMDESPGGCGSHPDFYALVTIAGEEFDNEDTPETEEFENESDISPNWEFSTSVELSEGEVDTKIEIRDEDGFLRFDDDFVDVDPTDDERTLANRLTLAPCAVRGETDGDCGDTLSAQGNESDSAEIFYRIEVVEPPSAPGLRTQCIHDPIWPQPGDTVRITAAALDGELDERVADSVEIWVDDQSGPAVAAAGTELSLDVGAVDAGTLSYGCRVQDEGLSVFTGWRVVNVGPPSEGEAVPVVYTGPRGSRLDLVFVADRDDYSSSTDPDLLTDVGSVILDAYYDFDIFLSNQDLFNFWIALDRGNAEDYEDGCDHDAPDIDWADSKIILHQDQLRDCATTKIQGFSSEPGSTNTIRHETGHRPFGLADEYCCDGGYYQVSPFPNIYDSRVATPFNPLGCEEDAPTLGRTPGDCRSWVEPIDWWFNDTWFTSEPASGDLMAGGSSPQAADIRRMNWLFSECRAAGC